MIPLDITTNLDLDPWQPADIGPTVDDGPEPATLERIGVLPNGTQDGRAVVGMVLRLPDGRAVIAQTTLRLFLTAAQAIAATPIAEMENM